MRLFCNLTVILDLARDIYVFHILFVGSTPYYDTFYGIVCLIQTDETVTITVLVSLGVSFYILAANTAWYTGYILGNFERLETQAVLTMLRPSCISVDICIYYRLPCRIFAHSRRIWLIAAGPAAISSYTTKFRRITVKYTIIC